ncbi:hypothetical protein NIES37_73240 (plasmid) [Tolypothrix tenuis PCC 7101]|uniref:Uncharacterized protein n=1 Tax=Tolypothrix tenuis PCC 7101 TaxID=231146 RepID=A0A1Z4NC57_9CYAN|nr:hypothetical protein NIES37_73240 [Tolypothrix tenuis PCC 7101]BAZ78718.1 hypothetical protein NIES50_73510 [Aulosira laxa NIES-50]
MAGLDSNKKRSNSGSKRVSRFSEVLGAAQESTQTSGYPENQLPEQPDTQTVEHSSSQQSTSMKTQVATNSDIQPSGYPDSQKPEQPDTQTVEHSSSQLSTHTKNQKPKQSKTQVAINSDTQPSGYPDIQKPGQSDTQTARKSKNKDKLAKRENPDYTQTTFRIPKKLSRQINRVLMDLADEGVEVDRSDLLEELANAFIRIADEVGVVEALEQIKNLGTQMDE